MNETTAIPEELIDALRSAKHVAVLTGAGVSKESGVPTFRDAQTGLWAQYDPQELATPQAFARNPKLVWDWYAWRRALVSKAKPNSGHRALVDLQHRVEKFSLITQNVDDLHRRAGSTDIIELHGNLFRTICSRGGYEVETFDAHQSPPPCPKCGALLRPGVVWFGESLPEDAITDALAATRNCDIFFSIGTSSLVQPAASLPYLAHEQGITTVEINVEPTPFTATATHSLSGPSGIVLPALLDALTG